MKTHAEYFEDIAKALESHAKHNRKIDRLAMAYGGGKEIHRRDVMTTEMVLECEDIARRVRALEAKCKNTFLAQGDSSGYRQR